MSRFSVIVPVHKVQGFLRACLDSVLHQDYADLELVVVDDASPDTCGEIAAEYAAADPRVVPVRLPATVGPGAARDAGAARATGDYLLFLDGDDLLAPGALTAIAARLDAAADPDVLLFDHDRLDVWERRRGSGDTAVLGALATPSWTGAGAGTGSGGGACGSAVPDPGAAAELAREADELARMVDEGGPEPEQDAAGRPAATATAAVTSASASAAASASAELEREAEELARMVGEGGPDPERNGDPGGPGSPVDPVALADIADVTAEGAPGAPDGEGGVGVDGGGSDIGVAESDPAAGEGDGDGDGDGEGDGDATAPAPGEPRPAWTPRRGARAAGTAGSATPGAGTPAHGTPGAVTPGAGTGAAHGTTGAPGSRSLVGRPLPLAAAEAPAGPGALVFTASEAPACLTVTPVAWNRVVRRDFWRSRGLAFTPGPGPYEEIVPAYAALLGAGRIAALDQVCVTWRRRRRGSVALTPGPRHLAAIERWAEVLDACRDRTVRDVLAGQRERRLRAVLRDGRRVRPADRAAFHRAAGLAGSPAADKIAELRAKAGRALRARRQAAARGAYRRYYKMLTRRPVDPNLAVYSAYWARGVACNPAAIHAKAAEIAPHVHGVWLVNRRDRDRIPPGVDAVEVGSRRYWEVMARAKYLVCNGSFPAAIEKRPEQVYLQTHHGTPLKHMGMDLRQHPAAAASTNFNRLLRHADHWDYSLSANPHSSQTWERVYPSDYVSLPTGYPRNDVFLTATAADVRAARAELGLAPGTVAILYAPTHRDYQRGFTAPLDLARLAAALGPGHVLLARAHYYYGRPGLPEHPGAVLDVSQHPSVERLALASDALLTDFSSVMFDYACLDRPIVVHAADWEAYAATRGVYFDLLSGRPGETPGPVAYDEEGVARVFRSGAWADERSAELRAAFRERFCPYDDGLAAERAVRRVLLGEPTLVPYLPFTARTPAPPPSVACATNERTRS
jgi:CDP-glycerol glycerophosphotransferase